MKILDKFAIPIGMLIVGIAVWFMMYHLVVKPLEHINSRIQKDFAQQYAILNDSFVTYKKDKEGVVHAETKANYLTADELKLINKPLYDRLEQQGIRINKLLSSLKVTVEYPAGYKEGPVTKDSISKRITLNGVDDSCITISAFVDSLKMGHIHYKMKPQTFEYNLYWKKGGWFKSDTLMANGTNNCGKIVRQKATVMKPKPHPEKTITTAVIVAGAVFLLFKLFGL